MRFPFLPAIRLCLLGGAIVFWAIAARADEPIFNARDGAAIDGYDVVAYFTTGEPTSGDPDIAVLWKGAVWLFISDENRERFEANPRAYAPQFGGYCAYGVSSGLVLRTDPRVWQIRDGKLYLIHNAAVWDKWIQDVPGNIERADANWPRVLASH
ncbi:YHS domain-containing (seleno)protein [Sedimentitalea nanhaiensis]|uniref:YHS domain-containing (seleno)protein n=1 Tax=Sedimentitalea nanhaiensis TaxID=999627 RepID=UPI001FDED98E|nr:YHS domain-containing (seleno)protein [Sedimentitalea nanhaiensis]